MDEQEVENPASISVNIPQSGALAPTGQCYVTSFLMTEKTFNMEDGTKKTALMGIDTNAFTTLVDYTNTNQPERPGRRHPGVCRQRGHAGRVAGRGTAPTATV